ncbi:type VI secretion system Vgr family protein [Burkholderia ubonensis]|uniref:type VI secretion system Vgr family protein n=1 Tax=Burkholderia ubonensis TaxID=101571 RepID=UPI000BA673A1|nr:type VI secretion system tip protein TssI/VgrG [Burkholderia ubonensis]PAK13060.1 type IV secretion protein Rhs [Burkholderia ubonensis]RQP31471.1 type VI secretion system tip protein VgrG [Burkholderia ubonensis]RQP34264.1 type VI secretion system tip protein VgrG [Burkholderia ubonensis]RQP37430.1 type VI secretion system tip protein VgrG [Burkholderia ubonensis]RQP51922.1 type VI secretion system tip protein VgrG [Burkholderia ubonensis]
MALRPSASGELKFRDLYDAINTGLLQRDRLLMLDTPLGKSAMVPLRARGFARIGRNYSYTVDVASLRDDTALLSLMHQPVTLWVQQISEPFGPSIYRPVHGFVHRVAYLGGDGGLTTYQLEFSSALVFLEKTHNEEGWLEKDAREIISDVLDRYPQLRGQYRFVLSSAPIKRSWCRQSESDLHFVNRLAEAEGWYFYWVHENVSEGSPPKTTLVVVDQVASLPDARSVEYIRTNGDDESDGFAHWAAVQTMQSTRYVSRAFDYKRPASDFQVENALAATNYVTEERQQKVEHSVPDAPMTVYESTAYGYSSSDHGEVRARRRVQVWDARASRYFGIGGVRWLDAGSRFVLNDHPRHGDGDAKKREFLVVEARWFIENNVPIGRQMVEFPHSLRATLAEQQAVHRERFKTPGHAADGSAGFFVVEVEAQPATVEYRSPLDHPKPLMSIEHALVVTPDGAQAWTNDRNQVRVHFAWDRKNPSDAFHSSPLLSSLQSDTGNGYGSVHVPRAREWVIVGYWNGDCDKPFVLGRINGGTTPSQWHSNALLSGFKSEGFGNTGAYNSLVHDDSTHQGGTRLVSYTGKSYAALTQGYLIKHDGNTRGQYLGAGFILHADEFGAVRASKGLSISAHPKAYDDEQMGVDEARSQLQQAGMLVESLSSASTTAQAESLQTGQDALKALSEDIRHPVTGDTSGGVTAGGGTGSANGFAQPNILVSTPKDIALVADSSTHIVAEKEVNVVSTENTYVATGKSFVVAAAEKVSFFAQKLGAFFVTAKGPIKLSANTDDVNVSAGKDVTVKAKRIVLDADEIIIKAGGSYTRWVAAGIEDGTQGPRTIKSASLSRQGPSSIAQHMNSLPQAKFNDPYVLRDRITGEALKNHPYELVRADGTRLTGITNELGHVAEQKSEDVESVMLRALRPGSNPGGAST